MYGRAPRKVYLPICSPRSTDSRRKAYGSFSATARNAETGVSRSAVTDFTTGMSVCPRASRENSLKDRVIQNSRWFLGQGLLTNEGSSWLRQRRLSQPAFHRDRLAMYAKTIAEYSHEAVSSWRDGEVRDLHQDMMELTLRIVAKLMFGVEVGEQTQRVSHALNLLMKHSSGIPMIMNPDARYTPRPPVYP